MSVRNADLKELASDALQASDKKRLLKPMLAMLGLVVALIVVIGATKVIQVVKIIHQAQAPQPPAVVTATSATYTDWQPHIEAVGSTKAIHGVDVTTEVPGMVRSVDFKPGQDVAAGAVLVELNSDTDSASLRQLQATADLAEMVFKRDQAEAAINAISQAQFDSDKTDLAAKQAAVDQQRALLEKKTIRAPFAGRIGITSVNPGQYLNPGDKIATLGSVDPIYVDFTVPQEQLSGLKIGQAVSVTSEGLVNSTFTGKVTAIDTKIDQTTRNDMVEATIANPTRQLMPGMFLKVAVAAGKPQSYLTLPQTAITFNPYGASVFLVVSPKTGDKQGVPTVQQTFVQTGATRGDQVAILSGLKAGDVVVTSGQMKLKTGSPVKIDNSAAPSNAEAPSPQEQ